VDAEGKDIRYTGDLYTVDMSLMDETCIANAAKINDRMACDTAVSVAQSNEWSKIYRSKTVRTSIQSNCWYMVQYDVNKLIEYYDVFFDHNSQWILSAFGINGVPQEGARYELYISNFTFDKPLIDSDITFENEEFGRSHYFDSELYVSRTYNSGGDNSQVNIGFSESKKVTASFDYEFESIAHRTDHSLPGIHAFTFFGNGGYYQYGVCSWSI
jgi:hypothetical protein